jgi:hypothetical protein
MKELEDYAWFPPLLRRFQAEYIGQLAARTKVYRPLLPILKKMIDQQRPGQITDLCTGNADPMLYMARHLPEPQRIVLTDKFPRPDLAPEPGIHHIHVLTTPFDVTTDAFAPDQLYTMFNAFHHFGPAGQLSLMQRVKASGSAFLWVEILEPGLFSAVKIAAATTVGQLLLAPFVRPFSIFRLLLTYVLPINLFTVTLDGLISVAKSKPLAHYQQLARVVHGEGYTVRAWQQKTAFFTTLTIIQGEPDPQ